MEKEIKSIGYASFGYSEINQSYQIMRRHEKPNCQPFLTVIAFLDKTAEGTDLRFVGNRPFEMIHEGEISLEDLWRLFKYAVKYVDNEIEFEKSEYEL